MKKILSYFLTEMKPYKWWYVLLLQTIFTAPLYYVIYNYSIKLLIDVIIENPIFDITKFYLPVGLYVFTEVYVNVVWRLSNFAAYKCIPQTENAIYLKAFNYVQNHSYKYFTEALSGSLVSKINGIASGFIDLLAKIHYNFFGIATSAVACVIAIGFVSFKLALFILAWTLCFVFVMGKLAKKQEAFSSAESEERHGVRGKVADCITNIFTIISFAARKREYDDLKWHMKHELLPKQKRVWLFEITFQTIGAFFYLILLTICICGVVYLRYNGDISVGDIYFVLSLAWNFMDNAWRATAEFESMLKTIGDLKSSFAVLNEPNDVDPNEGKALTVKKADILFENISFDYGGKNVFKGLNLQIKAGEKIGLVGVSGAGKSTIVNLLLRYLEPKNGVIKIDGQNIYEFSKNSLRESIAIIPQDIILFNRSLFENIKYGRPNATLEEVQEACKKAKIHNFIMELEKGYETLVGERGIKLSGGQRQRVGIARAILKKAKILILDEATSSLDSESEAFVQSSINNLLDRKITVIAIAHRLATLKHMDRILVLEKGKITEEGKHDELLSNQNSLYKKLWDSQKI